MNILPLNNTVINELLVLGEKINTQVDTDATKRLKALLESLQDTIIGSTDQVTPRMSLTAIEEALPAAIEQVQQDHPGVADDLDKIKSLLVNKS